MVYAERLNDRWFPDIRTPQDVEEFSAKLNILK